MRAAENIRDKIERFWNCLRHLSFVFMENDVASWSHDGRPSDTLDMCHPDDRGAAKVSDIGYVIDVFATLAG